jgi:hypothetical protein
MNAGSILDSKLEEWTTLATEISFNGILLGNGASRAVSGKFNYTSLYEKACNLDEGNRLTDADIRLFDHFKTHNFETILSSLAIANVVNSALGLDIGSIKTRYESIREALIIAVHGNHVEWNELSSDILMSIKTALRKYQCVYTTNYDLLLYWAIMNESSEGFIDYFWSEAFDISNVEIWTPGTKVLYLHGALHLSRTLTGGTLKARADESANLLDKFGNTPSCSTTPLIIAEGNSEEKKQSIFKSDYLSFGLARLAQHRGPICIFGHGLGVEDDHIIEAINNSNSTILGVSVYETSGTEIKKVKARANERFPNKSLRFFRATSHPLASKTLNVENLQPV